MKEERLSLLLGTGADLTPQIYFIGVQMFLQMQDVYPSEY